MSQIKLGGYGDPIPTMALPEMDDDAPFTVLIFTDDANFGAAYYRSLGFTHYETWCVGAVGGRGGDGTNSYSLPYERTRSPVPSDIWALHLEYLRVMDFFTSGEWDHIYHYGPSTELPNNGMITIVQHEEFYNPEHLIWFYTYKNAILIPEIEGMGGGGGGGGLRKGFGELVDLPDLVPVVVGKAGVDAGYAQTIQLGSFTPEMPPVSYPNVASEPESTEKRLHELSNFFHTYQRSYPGTHTTFTGNPVKGEDGGASSFGDVTQASGGKGGEPGMVWDGSKFIPKGHGGAGGVGGQLTAGGGAAGSISQTADGANGIWFYETGIGQGGGGGKGGLPTTPATNIPFYRPPVPNPATAGGQGSYSFADTSVYGQRQYRQPWTYIKPVQDLATGTWTYVPTTDTGYMVTPGSGGGARPTPNLKFGSRAEGFSPNGVVMLRLAKVV